MCRSQRNFEWQVVQGHGSMSEHCLANDVQRLHLYTHIIQQNNDA